VPVKSVKPLDIEISSLPISDGKTVVLRPQTDGDLSSMLGVDGVLTALYSFSVRQADTPPRMMSRSGDGLGFDLITVHADAPGHARASRSNDPPGCMEMRMKLKALTLAVGLALGSAMIPVTSIAQNAPAKPAAAAAPVAPPAPSAPSTAAAAKPAPAKHPSALPPGDPGRAQPPASAQVVLKFHTFMNAPSNVWDSMLAPWMDKIEKESGGRIWFDRYSAMTFGGKPSDLFDQVVEGKTDVTWTLPGNTPGKFPRLEVFELPFTMTNADATSRAYWEYTQTCGKGDIDESKVKLLVVNVHSPGVLHSRDVQIRSVEDMRGLRVRGATRQVSKLLTALGATPVTMPLPAVPKALESGDVDAIALPWEVAPAVRVPQLAKFHTDFDPSVGGLYTTNFIVPINRAKYDSLPADLKKVIDDNTGMEPSATMGRNQQAGDPAAIKAADDMKNTRITVRGKDLDGFKRAANYIEDQWIKEMNDKGINGKGLRQCALQLVDKHTKK
jgi:TRAP-type C4-dicarboxylate transport system substrate-binding protein